MIICAYCTSSSCTLSMFTIKQIIHNFLTQIYFSGLLQKGQKQLNTWYCTGAQGMCIIPASTNSSCYLLICRKCCTTPNCLIFLLLLYLLFSLNALAYCCLCISSCMLWRNTYSLLSLPSDTGKLLANIIYFLVRHMSIYSC